MEKIYSIDEINKINRTTSAVSGVIYSCKDGNKFVGTTTGNLLIAQKAANIILSEETIKETGYSNAESAIVSAVGRTYESVIDFGLPEHSEETTVEFQVNDPKVTKKSKIHTYVVYDDNFFEHDMVDHVLEQLTFGAIEIIEKVCVKMIAYAPNGTHGRYKLKIQIS